MSETFRGYLPEQQVLQDRPTSRGGRVSSASIESKRTSSERRMQTVVAVVAAMDWLPLPRYWVQARPWVPAYRGYAQETIG